MQSPRILFGPEPETATGVMGNGSCRMILFVLLDNFSIETGYSTDQLTD